MRCKYGKLKHKVGRRVCRKRPARRRRSGARAARRRFLKNAYYDRTFGRR